ncbi:MAG: hypothetical protein IKM77_04055, partial [Prevotella sp.]|nr:hypothetical protein [Prevotella sp.]
YVGPARAKHVTGFGYDDENRVTALTFTNGSVGYTYDALGRISQRTVKPTNTAIPTTYTYVPGGHGTDSTTGMIQTIAQGGVTLTYQYDDRGNITSVSDGTKTTSYVYDAIGQLIQVDDEFQTTWGGDGTRWVFTYDLGGNMLTRTAYKLINGLPDTVVWGDTFTYGNDAWRDQLTAVNGVPITYDAIGNLTSDGVRTYEWEHGKQLKKINIGSRPITFEYNEDGLRTKKTVVGLSGTVVTEYTLHGKNITHMTRGADTLHFYYDAQNKPAVVIYNSAAYGYLYNLQGDVVALVDGTGAKVVEYGYDAWGKPTSKTGTMAGTLGTVQPFRYRGYVYDEETGDYYLRSRYYRAEWGRFVNADALVTGSLYSYCVNDPIAFVDQDGNKPLIGGIFRDESFDSLSYHNPDGSPFMRKIKPKVKMETIPLGFFLACLDEIYRNRKDWEYSKGPMQWGKVDCVGIVRIIVQQMSNFLAAKIQTRVDGLRQQCGITEENGVLTKKTVLVPGMALFSYDPDHISSITGIPQPWYHVGIYLGDYNDPITGKYIPNAVIQAANSQDGIIVTSLSETNFTHFGFFWFVSYSFAILLLLALTPFGMHVAFASIEDNPWYDEYYPGYNYEGTWDQYLLTNEWRDWYIIIEPGNGSENKKAFFLSNNSTGETICLGYIASCGIFSLTESEAFLLLDFGYKPDQNEQPGEQYRFMNQEQVFDTIFTLPIFDYENLQDGVCENAYPFPVANEEYKYGYINKQAEWIIEPQYMDASPFVLLDGNNPFHQQLIQLSSSTILSGMRVAIVYTFDEEYIIIDESNDCKVSLGDYCRVHSEMGYLNSIFFHY